MAESCDREGRPTCDRGSVSYSAAIESAASLDPDPEISPFAQRVVIGDGAPWIWWLATEEFPGAVQILDLYHAKQHLSKVAKAVHGSDPALAEAWADLRHAELDTGRIDAVLTALRENAGNCEKARKCLDYVESNRQRMRYKDFRAVGLCVGSGVVEAGCKVTVGSRCK